MYHTVSISVLKRRSSLVVVQVLNMASINSLMHFGNITGLEF
jgi:hypothetical protein